MGKQSGTTDNGVRAYETEHRKVALLAAEEGIVLLKNEGLLPLKQGETLGLFGSGARKTVKGGTGSGDVNERSCVSVEQGLLAAGFVLADSEWLDAYDEVYENARQSWKKLIQELTEKTNFIEAYFGNPFQNPAENPITEAMAKKAKTAIYVLSRISGEGADRRNKRGDFCLSKEEEQNIRTLAAEGCDIVLVINTGGLVDLSLLDELPQIRAVLYLSQGGMEGGTALGKVLSGSVTPSGKLTDSWANHYEDWPCAESFGSNNGDLEKEYYKEGIFVGYRWFDATQKSLRYPFGYGLSYTKFAFEESKVQAEKTGIAVQVKVHNGGEQFAGKEVLQVYLSAPQCEGRARESKKLVAFAKTPLLQPKESCELICQVSYRELARFDEERQAWVVDAGEYGLAVGSDSQNLFGVAILRVSESFVLEETACVSTACEELVEFSLNGSQLFVSEDLPVLTLSKEQILESEEASRKQKEETEEEKALSDCAEKIVQQLSEEQMIQLVCGRVNEGKSALGASAFAVPGAAGETVDFETQPKLPSMILADGPAGIRLSQHYQAAEDGSIYPVDSQSALEHGFFAEEEQHEGATVYYQYCTAFPIGTMLAQTWNTDVLKEVGRAVGEEMRIFGVDLWLAPGMNIHRNPLCGRNFEYYSEDPLLSGKLAAAITQGVQEKGINGTTIKHFACNNQEDNRLGVDSIVSERALREIYLKGFEIAVKESQPFAIMTSYNQINGLHSANHAGLCTEAARKEWGFEGLIMTDWTTTINGSEAYLCIRAGNDLIMPGLSSDHANIRNALKDGRLKTEELRLCAYRIVKMSLRTAARK